MINTINELEIQMDQTEEEIKLINREIFEMEMKELNEIIAVVKNRLNYAGIYGISVIKKDYFREVGSYSPFATKKDFHWATDSYKDEEGFELKGALVYSFEGYYYDKGNLDIEERKEVFVLEDGSLKVFDSKIEIHLDETETEPLEKYSYKDIADDQSLFRCDIGVIINNIIENLKLSASELDKRKNDRMARLAELKKAQ